MSDNTTTTTTSHKDAAKAMIDKIRGMRQEIPNFVIPQPGAGRRKLTCAATVPPDFVELTCSATQTNDTLVRGGASDPEEVRDLMVFAEAYGPVADEMEAFTRFLRYSVSAARNKAGRHALTTYSLAQRLAGQPETSELAPVAEAMRRNLGRQKKAKAQPSTPTPEPTPEPAPTSGNQS